MSVETTIEFERECRWCYGRSAYIPDQPCEHCRSTGRLPTSLGIDLLEFLEHQGFTRTSNQHHERKGVR